MKRMIKVNHIETNNYLVKSRLPSADIVINPYIGCTHNCLYCYADFMKRFTNHKEPWGTFLDVKHSKKIITNKAVAGKNILLSSTTDAYNPQEEKFQITRSIIEQLENTDANVNILTKNALVVRDLDIFKKMGNKISIAMSVNTTNDQFRHDMEPFASSIKERLNALTEIHKAGIKTSIFISPIFPGITDFKEIIDMFQNVADDFWFENLNLYPSGFHKIIKYIQIKYPNLVQLYNQIYVNKDTAFWAETESKIATYCMDNNIPHKIYFYHKKIRK